MRRRIHTPIDQENYTFFPAKEPRDFFGESSRLSVAVYARVSTGNVEQTSSYELQKKYYEDYVRRHPNWTLARIYADEGISGTSLAHREQFHQMITDCKAGKIDLILTKSVSRFARNVVDCISTVRMLGELPSPVGVFFESECIFSLKEDSQMALSFQATMAQEESHTRNRSMETSLRMRLDGGLPLTPKLLGYSHDGEGNLVVNPKEAPTVKLIFYLYLYGYSTSEIAEILTRQGRKTYLGNIKWTSNAVVQVLRNERHCGDVLTRKTFTPNYLTHTKQKRIKATGPKAFTATTTKPLSHGRISSPSNTCWTMPNTATNPSSQSFGWWTKGCCGASWCSIPAGLDFGQRITCKLPLPPTQEKRRRGLPLQPGMASSGRAPSCFQTCSRHPWFSSGIRCG